MRRILALAVVVGISAWGQMAAAAPISMTAPGAPSAPQPVGPLASSLVIPGSTYDILLFDSLAFNLNASPLVFDGTPQSFFLVEGGIATVTESETALAGGRSRIDISVEGDADLFPSSLGGSGGFISVGGVDPLDLVGPIRLASAFLTFRDANGNIFASGDCASLVVNRDPWDGSFLGPASPFALGCGFGGNLAGVRQIDLSLVVPEPATVLLLGGALGAVAYRRRRQSRGPA